MAENVGVFLLVLAVKKEKNWRRRRQAGGLKEERKGKGGAGKEKEGLDSSWAITMAPCMACLVSRICVLIKRKGNGVQLGAAGAVPLPERNTEGAGGSLSPKSAVENLL